MNAMPSCAAILDTATERQCGAPLAIADVVRYEALMEGRKLVKVRVVCSCGHSAWVTADLGPIEAPWEDGVVPGAGEGRDPDGHEPPCPAVAHADVVTGTTPESVSPTPARVVKRGRGGVRPGSGRRAWIWTQGKAERLAELWNAGIATACIAQELEISTSSVRGMVSEMRRRYPLMALARRAERLGAQ